MSASGSSPTAPSGWDPHIRPLHFRGVHVHHHLRGQTRGRLRGHLVLLTFVVALSVSVGIGAAVVALVAPGSAPLCQPYTPCGPATSGMGLVSQTVWRSSQYGFTVEYPGSALSTSQQSGSGLVLDLQAGGSGGTIVVLGAPAAQASPAKAITSELAKLSGVSQLAADTSQADRLLGPGVGYRSGVGGVYTGFGDASQGVGGEQTIYAESATDGRVTITVLAIAPANDAGPKSAIAQAADLVINSVRWS
jgi:hypothetical protein